MKQKYKLNMALGGYAVNRVINLEVNDRGVIVSKYWRARYEESARNGCMELVTKTAKLRSCAAQAEKMQEKHRKSAGDDSKKSAK